jgi:hypothetical protein
MPMDETPRYWFRAKTFGWGWGLPTAWQGWVVYAIALLLLVANAFAFPPSQDPLRYVVGFFVVCALLVAVCALKGEPPSWRWGRRK